ncbi:outer membrane protein [Helicobacter baculiformis]|uniref:Outer membrane protein n=1 Tax=Helicobacter baculiformis TaxID=427351 RepID=A0ABV7ZGA6_9HELI|nr:outer membrane protein [Helicobacter baculiformis]
METGFQYSYVTGKYYFSQPTIPSGHFKQQGYSQNGATSGNLFGGDLQIGYKQFFGANKTFGLRYYVFFSGQVGNERSTRDAVSSEGLAAYSLKMNVANLFYGAGIDALYNFYENSDHAYGIFVGTMLGGSSWFRGVAHLEDGRCFTTAANQCVSIDNYYLQYAKLAKEDGDKASFNPTYVQLIFNVGFRINFSKYQGLEMGARIPVIDDPYYTEKDSLSSGGYKYNITLRRAVVAFTNYVINF